MLLPVCQPMLWWKSTPLLSWTTLSTKMKPKNERNQRKIWSFFFFLLFFRFSAPPAVDQRTVKLWFAQFDVHFVVCAAQPLCKCSARLQLRRRMLQRCRKVGGAPFARKNQRQRVQKRVVRLYRALVWLFRVVGSHGVQKRPGAIANLINGGWFTQFPRAIADF